MAATFGLFIPKVAFISEINPFILYNMFLADFFPHKVFIIHALTPEIYYSRAKSLTSRQACLPLGKWLYGTPRYELKVRERLRGL
jgi:hypothetical protein